MDPMFDPVRFAAATLDVLASTRASPAALAARQRARLDRLLSAAMRDSAFYASHLPRNLSSATQLGALPTVSRQVLMENFDDWVTDPHIKLSDLSTFTADLRRVGDAYLGRYLVWESSGTSNHPGIFVQNVQTLGVYDALEAVRRSPGRPLQRCVDPMMLTERFAFVGATSGHFASYVTMQRLREINPLLAPAVRCFSILQCTSALVDALNAFKPTVIATYPTAAAMLADEADRGCLTCRPREIWSGGETLSPTVRSRLEHVLACTVRNSYGASEFLPIAWECGHGCLHVNADWVILEPVDEHARAMPAGELSYTTLLTNLANPVQPLIRYDLGDQIILHPGNCTCGSSLPVIEVQGRRDDALVMAGQHGRTVTLLPLALTTVLEDQAGVFDFQLEQRNDHTLALRLAVPGPEGEVAAQRCRVALHAFAAVQRLQPIRINVDWGQLIRRGRSGKAQRIVAKIK